MLRRLWKSISLLPLALQGVRAVGGAMQGMEDALEIQREQTQRLRDFLGPNMDPSSLGRRQQAPTITFSNPKAQDFFVDGTKIPEGSHDGFTGEIYWR